MTEPTHGSTDPGLAVAVVGMGCRFPGGRDLDEYWESLRTGACAIVDFDAAELAAAGVDEDQRRDPRYVAAKGYLADADCFEAERFGFTATEAAALDPQHRLLLETAWTAFEDAGYDPRQPPARTGVYVGGGLSEHMLAALADPELAASLGSMQVRILTDRDFLAPWVSYRLDLSGPSITVQTACSSSLTAVHLAVQALALGECDAALAGGVTIDSVYPGGYLYQEGGILSPDGRCRPFDEKAAGTVPGNGVGVVLLRRLADALAAGDPVRAVIRGSAVTNDGAAKLGFTAPGVDQQTAAIVEAWTAAGLHPAVSQYVETHGTGTELGDRVEIAALRAAFEGGPGSPPRSPLGSPPGTPAGGGRCGIGSVKSNLGHLDAAAGVAAFIKTVLMLEHRLLAPTVNVTRPHPDLRLDASPFALVDRPAPWPDPERGGPRLAGVSSLGIGGTNVHAVLAEAPEAARRPHPRTHRFAGRRYAALRPGGLPAASAGPAGPAASATPAGPAAPAATGQDPRAAVAAVLRATLGLTDADDLDQSYLAAGGDSLTAVHLAGRFREQLGADVPVELLLEPVPLRELVDRIAALAARDDPLASLLDELENEPANEP